MIRFLRIGRLGIKKLRITFSLLRMSFSAIFFEHQKYFIYCLVLSVIQFGALLTSGFIHSKLRLSLMISESLAGLNFFEIVFESVNAINLMQILSLASVLCIELYLIYVVCSAISYSAKATAKGQTLAVAESFKNAAYKTPQLFGYSVLETIILFLCALTGVIGNVVYFGWRLLTILNIQYISFESNTIWSALYCSAASFLKNIVQAISIDALLELILIVAMSVIYYFSQQSLFEPIKSVSDNYVVAFFLVYLLSILYLVENVTFTLLYIEIKKNRS